MDLLQTFWVPAFMACAIEYGEEAYYDLTTEEITLVEQFIKNHPGHYDWSMTESNEYPDVEFREKCTCYLPMPCLKLSVFA